MDTSKIGPGSLKTLTYHITQSDSVRSFDPKDSDYAPNGLHMRQLVGTLVKYNSINTFQPFLAESWNVSEDGREWSFNLREQITCEDGTPLTASNFKMGLELAFRNHAPDPTTPVFSDLVGWSDFVSSRSPDLPGLAAPSDDTLVMKFTRAPTGVESYLSMPYFGFYCSANFDDHGKWRDQSKIISSGPYRLKGSTLQRDFDSIELERRTDWNLGWLSKSPDNIVIQVTPREALLKQVRAHSIVEVSLGDDDEVGQGWQQHRGAVTISSNIVLNPKRKFFSNPENRKMFASLIRSELLKERSNFRSITLSSLFYPFVSSEMAPLNSESAVKHSDRKSDELQVEDFSATNSRAALIKRLMQEVPASRGFKVRKVSLSDSRLTRAEAHKARNDKLDIYSIVVDKGGAAEPWLVKLMFCSDLGVEFPDPSGRIAELVSAYEGKRMGPDEFSTFGSRFEQIVAEDSAVIPVLHRGHSWLYSGDVLLAHLSANIEVTDLQAIELE